MGRVYRTHEEEQQMLAEHFAAIQRVEERRKEKEKQDKRKSTGANIDIEQIKLAHNVIFGRGKQNINSNNENEQE